MSNPETFTRNVSVPSWMVQIAVWTVGVLALGAVSTLVSVVNWAFVLQNELGTVKSDMAAAKVKETDLVNSVNALGRDMRDGFSSARGDVQQLQRDVDVLKSRAKP